MNKLISWYNQNRKKIWITLITGLGLFFIAWRLFFMFDLNNGSDNIDYMEDQISDNLNSITLSSGKSAISNERVDLDKEGITTIDNFISYCNSGNLQEAYKLITDECKEEMFPNINRFQEIYYQKIFGNGRRNIKIQNWNGNIYAVDFSEDALSSGVYSTEDNIRDYITIVTNKEKKIFLNINGYLGRKTYNKTTQTGNLKIVLKRKDSYMNYEKYTFEFINNSGNEILLGKIEEDDNISYLVDSNNIKYSAAINELTESQLTISGLQTKTLQIKYFNPYVTTKNIKGLVFSKIYLSYNAYKAYQNKSLYKDYGNVYISL